jgi:hypothetical protein
LWVVGLGASEFDCRSRLPLVIAVRTDREMHEVRIAQARLVTVAVNLKHVQALTRTETDLSSLDYCIKYRLE